MPHGGFVGIPARDPTTLPAYAGTLVVSSTTAPVLPDLTQYTYPPTILAPSNAGAVPATFKTADGWSGATGFVAGTLGQLAPLANPIPRGVWGSTVLTPPTLSTVTGGGALTVQGSAVIDAANGITATLHSDGSNFFAVCENLNSGACSASPLSLFVFNNANAACIYPITTTTFLVGGHHGAANYTFAVVTLNPATLALTLGSTATTGTALFDTPVQCSAQYYAFQQNNATAIRGCYVTGTVPTVGTAAASGGYSDTTQGTVKLAKITGGSPGVGQCFAFILQTGGGAGSRNPATAVVTIAITTGNATVAAAVAAAAENNAVDASIKAFIPGVNNAANAVLIYASASNAAYRYLTANYGTPASSTLTSFLFRAETVPTALYHYGTWIYKKTGVFWGLYASGGNDYVALGHLATGVYAIGPINSGVAPVAGSTLVYAAAKTFPTDASGYGSLYACSSGLTDLLTTSGTTLSVNTSLAVTATVIKDPTFNEKTAYYKGVWYALAMPTVQAVLSPSMWMFTSGNNLLVCGPVK